jgi:hypothetical protein
VRAEAASIVHGRRFRSPWVPRPFTGILRTLGRWLEPVSRPFRPLGRWFSRTVGAQLAVVALVFAAALLISVRLVGRRGARTVGRSQRGLGAGGAGLYPDELERQAAAAEKGGDLDGAVRLRFLAGVLRLDRAGVISYRASLTTGQLRSTVRSASFAELATMFDEVAYGGRRAEPSDVDAARATWPRVLSEARG